jgi:polar amino acid transport system substrate-binding protein
MNKSGRRCKLGPLFIGALCAIMMSVPAFADLAEKIQKLPKNEEIYAKLPDAVKSAGKINAATSTDSPPWEFIDEKGELTGADIDLSRALSRVLGVEIVNHKTEFSNIMPGIQSKRFDIGISSIGDFKDRQETVDFVDYYRGGISFLTRAGTPQPKTLLDLCGKTLGVLKGSNSESRAIENNQKCGAEGKPAISVNSYPTQNDAVLALTSSRVDYVSADASTNGYSARQLGGSLENVTSDLYGGAWLAGIAVPKDSPLYQPIFDAMGVLMTSGVYKDILDHWGVADGALPEPSKNMGVAR